MRNSEVLRIRNNIDKRCTDLAIEVFNPEDATDSDGYDQATHQGILMALDIVNDEFAKALKYV